MIDVLVVDDDFMVARVNAGFVAGTPGFRVVGTVHAGASALSAVEELMPDLVLLDVYLPDISGLDVLSQLRREAPEVDVLMVTAARDLETIQQAMRGGVVHYLVKPFDQATLRNRLAMFAQRQRVLADLVEASQEDLDRIFGGGRAHRASMPKGLTIETAELVRADLMSAGGLGRSATECGAATGLSRVSARRYLEFFAAAERAEVRPRYGATGRPERRYHWTG